MTTVDVEAHASPFAAQIVHSRQRGERSRRLSGDELDGRPGQVPQLLERTALHDPALPDDRDPVGQRFDLGEDVAGQQHRAARRPGLTDALLEHGFHQRIESGRRLVEQQQLDVAGQCGDQRDLLPVALGVGAPLLPGVEVEPLTQLLPAGGVSSPTQPGEEIDRLTSGQIGPQLHITGYVGETAVQRHGVGPRVAAEQPSRSAVLSQEAEKDPDGGGLARAVGAEETVHFSGLHGQVELVQGSVVSEGLDDSAHLDGRRHGDTSSLVVGLPGERAYGAGREGVQGEPSGRTKAGRTASRQAESSSDGGSGTYMR